MGRTYYNLAKVHNEEEGDGYLDWIPGCDFYGYNDPYGSADLSRTVGKLEDVNIPVLTGDEDALQVLVALIRANPDLPADRFMFKRMVV